MKKAFFTSLVMVGVLTTSTFLSARAGDTLQVKDLHPANTVTADADNAGLKLPDGFGALKVAEGLGTARHITVTPKGDIYVKLADLKNGKSIYFLHDDNGDGKAEIKTGFTKFTGTGIKVKNGYLYASSDEEVFRFKLDANSKVINPDNPEKIVTGLISRHEHEAKAIRGDIHGGENGLTT